jgi:hypothetical protein
MARYSSASAGETFASCWRQIILNITVRDSGTHRRAFCPASLLAVVSVRAQAGSGSFILDRPFLSQECVLAEAWRSRRINVRNRYYHRTLAKDMALLGDEMTRFIAICAISYRDLSLGGVCLGPEFGARAPFQNSRK